MTEKEIKQLQMSMCTPPLPEGYAAWPSKTKTQKVNMIKDQLEDGLTLGHFHNNRAVIYKKCTYSSEDAEAIYNLIERLSYPIIHRIEQKAGIYRCVFELDDDFFDK